MTDINKFIEQKAERLASLDHEKDSKSYDEFRSNMIVQLTQFVKSSTKTDGER